MLPATEAVIERLDATRQRWWLFTLLTTGFMATCLSLGTLLAFVLCDALVTFSQTMLTLLFVTWALLTLALAFGGMRRLLRSQRSLEATARRIEAELPELGSHLINLVQLAGEGSEASTQRHPAVGVAGPEAIAFDEAAARRAAAQVGDVAMATAADRQTRRRRFLCCMQTPRDMVESLVVLMVLGAIALACHVCLASWDTAASRLMRPWEFVPSVGLVKIVSVTPGDADVILGGSLQITATIENPEATPHQAVLFMTAEGGEEASFPMAADATHTKYRFTVPTVVGPMVYRLEIGDSQTRLYEVTVGEKPTIERIDVTYHYPTYLDWPAKTRTQGHADLEAPEYTTAELRVHPSVPITSGSLRLRSQELVGRVEAEGRLLVFESLALREDTTFTISMFSVLGHTDPDPRVNRIRVFKDMPPTVSLLKPARQSRAAPGDEIVMAVRAGDDHGIGRIRLEMRVTKTPNTDSDAATADDMKGDLMGGRYTSTTRIHEWTDFAGETAPIRSHHFTLDAAMVRAGQTAMVRAIAWDRRRSEGAGLRLVPQVAEGPWHAIRIVTEEAQSAEALDRIDSIRGAIWKVLQRQLLAQARTTTMVTREQLATRLATANDVRRLQVNIQKASLAVVKSIGQAVGESDAAQRLAVKRILSQLAFGDMLHAVAQCDRLVKVKRLDAFDTPTATLLATQGHVVAVLRKLLDATRRAESEALTAMENRPGADLPDDVRDRLEDLTNKLDEALQQQRRVVEAAERLAKAPVEDFAEAKEQLLEAIAAAEDEWSRFMNELNTDLSKLPEQDFANPTLLSELVEIQTEIKMAEDALLKKTADIAVPLEQLGYEMAEEIKTNLEKWLPDTPDRERWSQEESLTDADKEAPMAELPGELEDLIGELMEEESDLFDEMEDVTSSAVDSLDKGGGWDVADGPISNMSAKGATGNRLPNTSEIGGRAGEGRSGKSSGEFVGDQAIGKGGRKTPTRLTPDAYVGGQIKDFSKDPTGGATGGGKESGQGGEGLEGPVPRSPGPRELQRLAGKQAALRNKAEAIDLQFQIMDFHHTDLDDMITMMHQIERDLKAGRYHNALRQRQVMLDHLGRVKQYVDGEFDVRQDATINLPAAIQKELLGSMQDPSPVGWESLNRSYFERIATGGQSEDTNIHDEETNR